jgi:hemoglobin
MVTLYERVGGEQFFETLAGRFYAGVASDPVLRPLYPEDLSESKVHLTLFLIQYWGGPATYAEQRGHPRLRMRHAPFVIGEAQRDAWVRHMAAAVTAAGLPPEEEGELMAYFTVTARSLLNVGRVGTQIRFS